MKKFYFFHGLESTPTGSKYQRLKEEFKDYELQSPDFQGMDLEERLEKALRITAHETDLVIVGSSFGGLLASALYSLHPERIAALVLMAPALHRADAQAYVERLPTQDRIVVIHGRDDDVVPLDAVRSFLKDHLIEVVEVDDGHRLAQSQDLMVEATRRFLES